MQNALAVVRGVIGLLVLACCAGATTQPAAKTEENPHLWKPRTTSVAVFKNGYGFFMGSADVALRDGWCTAACRPGLDSLMSSNQVRNPGVVPGGFEPPGSS